ncbi:MAG TPA: ferredoxin [Candidatus Xenobia bacterium]|jgi:ferredoxin
MKPAVVVDLNRCQGYAQCVFAAPEVFWLHGNEALEYDPVFDPELLDKVRRAVRDCPTRAISLGTVE